MTRLGRSVAALAILASITISGSSIVLHDPSTASAAKSAPLLLRPTLTVSSVNAGGHAGLFVHAPAFAQLTLSVTYPGGVAASYQGKTDGQGRYTFNWTAPANLRQSGAASLRVIVQRDGRRATWSGQLTVHRALPPTLFIQPVADHVTAGTTVGIFVSTTPNATFTYRLTTSTGSLISKGSAQADAQGRYMLHAPEGYLPKRAAVIQVAVTVSGPGGARTNTARVNVLPRPPLPLSVTIQQKAVHTGRPMTVVVVSAPKTKVSLTVALTSTVVARGSGTTDAKGRWTFTTALEIPIAKAKAAHITVQASHGIDQIGGHTSFLLQPDTPGIFDSLATAADPAPNLANYFTQIPAKVIMVSAETSGQTLRAYQNGVLVHEDYVTTGMPELPTPPGAYQVMAKYSPYEMISPWPAGSPYYYPPSMTNFAMLFRDGGYFLHDAPWRAVYGPGTNLPHASDPGEPIGTHGCVNLPYPDMVWLWNWTPVGTTVVVY